MTHITPPAGWSNVKRLVADNAGGLRWHATLQRHVHPTTRATTWQVSLAATDGAGGSWQHGETRHGSPAEASAFARTRLAAEGCGEPRPAAPGVCVA